MSPADATRGALAWCLSIALAPAACAPASSVRPGGPGGDASIAPATLVDATTAGLHEDSPLDVVRAYVSLARRHPCRLPVENLTRTRHFSDPVEDRVRSIDALARAACTASLRRVPVAYAAAGIPALRADRPITRRGVVLLPSGFSGPLPQARLRARGALDCGGTRVPGATVTVAVGADARYTVQLGRGHADTAVAPRGACRADATNPLALRPGLNELVVFGPARSPFSLWVDGRGVVPSGWITWRPGQTRDITFTIGPFERHASEVGFPECSGYFSAEPTFTLAVQASGGSWVTVSALAAGSEDGVIAIRAPDGTISCNDDWDDLNPGVSGYFAEGPHQVWLGTYSQGTTFSTTASVR